MTPEEAKIYNLERMLIEARREVRHLKRCWKGTAMTEATLRIILATIFLIAHLHSQFIGDMRKPSAVSRKFMPDTGNTLSIRKHGFGTSG